MILPAFGVTASQATERPEILANCRQCVIVVTDSWRSDRGKLWLFDRGPDTAWRQFRGPMAVVVGKSGLAWGRGLVDPATPAAPVKKEGDNKAPAGVFRLRYVFGYVPSQKITRMPYLALSKQFVAVDDSRSRYYNQIVDRARIRDVDWSSAEPMILKDDRYKWGVFVEHNVPPLPGAGSCIFLHIWKNEGTPTSGCTAMSENDLSQLIRWLDPGSAPVLIQLPAFQYEEACRKLKVPQLQPKISERRPAP